MDYEEAMAALQAMDGERVRVNVQHRWRHGVGGVSSAGPKEGWDISASFTVRFDFSPMARSIPPLYLDEFDFVSAGWSIGGESLAIQFRRFLITVQPL